MKKILLYITLILGIVYFGACNLNDYPTFDDKDAFATFESARISVREDAGTLKVPVRVSSLKGISTTVSLEVKDGDGESGNAVSGRDYKVKGGATVLNFDGSDPIQYLEIEIIEHEGEFTGDLQFTVSITDAGSVDVGGNNSLVINIQDLDHPLSSILGEYEVFGPNYFGGRADTWTVELEKDPDGDVTKVWITNLVVAGTNQKVYGIVSEEMDKIEIPVKQTIVETSAYDSVILEGFDDPDVGKAGFIPDGGKLTLNLTQKAPITYVMDLPFGSHIIDEDSWYSIVLAGAKFTKVD